MVATTGQKRITAAHGCAGRMRALRRRARTEQSGFTIVETVVAITIAAMVFTATALMLGGALKGTLLARQNEQAAEVLTAEIEAVRSQDYAAVSMVTADLAGDPAISGGMFDHDGPGPLSAQALFHNATGVVNPHVRTVTLNGTDYTVRRYVSEEIESGTNARVKRVTAIAGWQSGGRQHERSSSTLITRVRRGLPLPEFTWGPQREITGAPGGGISFPVTLTNHGARDRWNLTVTSSGLTAGWTWYHDVDGDKVLSAVDTPLTNTDADPLLLVDTGWIQVDETRNLVVVYAGTIPTPMAPTYSVELTARSSAQPDVPPGKATVVDTVKREAATIPGCSTCVVETYQLLNQIPVCSTSCGTTAGDPLPLDGALPAATALADFDTDIDTAPTELRAGRRVGEGGAGMTETNRTRMVRWSRQMGIATTVSTQASLQIYAAPLEAGSDGSVTFTAHLIKRPQGSGSNQILGSMTATLTGTDPTAFELKQLDIPLPSPVAFGKNDRIEVQIVVSDDIAGTDAMRVAYDTTATVAALTYGVTS